MLAILNVFRTGKVFIVYLEKIHGVDCAKKAGTSSIVLI